MIEHISFDLETLGHTPTAPIIQIGAVKFDTKCGIYSEFKVNVDLKSLDKYNFTMDGETIKWWFSQSREAIDKVITSKETVTLSYALHLFYKWIEKPADYIYWSHSIFDPPILFNNNIQVGRNMEISHKLFRDLATLSNIYKVQTGTNIKDILFFGGTQHDALDDARYQAVQILRMIKDLKLNY